MYYGRERDHKDTSIDPNEIRVHALGFNANLRSAATLLSSGWYQGWLGADVSVFSNIDLDLMGGSGHGQSEVLYYNEKTGEERSSSRIGKARAKMKFGDETVGANILAGYTDINAGTIGTSAGINSHTYRGIDAKFDWHNLELSYGWADRFQNDWDDQYRKLTNSWHQNKHLEGGENIDFIHSLGARYTLNEAGWVDVAYGEGKDFRKNYHVAGAYDFELGNDSKLTLTSYYQSAKYQDGAAGSSYIKGDSAEREYTWSSSAILAKGGWKMLMGYGQTEARDSGEYQLRLTAWGNSDHRNFLQTWAQLDDFLWDGQKVVKLAASYDFEGRWKGLSTGVNYNYGWDNYNNRGEANENRDGKMQALDFQVSYSVQSGALKGLWFGVFPGFLRVDDTKVKSDRNDIKVMATYNVKVF